MKDQRAQATLPKSWGYWQWLWSRIDGVSTVSMPKPSHLWLPGLFLAETFLMFPMDLVLAGFCYKKKNHAYSTAIICALCSTFSAMVSYVVGFFAWEQLGKKIVSFVISQDLFSKIIYFYQKYQFPAVFIGGLLPIPVKSVTISAGFCKLSIVPFLVAVLMSRLIRFLSVAYIAKNFGDKAFQSLKQVSSIRFIPLLILSVQLIKNWVA